MKDMTNSELNLAIASCDNKISMYTKLAVDLPDNDYTNKINEQVEIRNALQVLAINRGLKFH